MRGMISRLAGTLALVTVMAGMMTTAEAARPAAVAHRGAHHAPVTLSVELRVLQLLNNDRAAHGLGALTLSQRLSSVARAHSADMATRHYFAHATPDGRSPFDRMAAAGVRYQVAGENLGQASGYAPLEAAKVLNDQMMAEPANQENHRAIILHHDLHKVGIGIVLTANSGVYLTEDFTN